MGLEDWQKHLGRLYGENNKQKGIEYILNRLFKEEHELRELEHWIVYRDPKRPEIATMDEAEHEYGKELADGMAWVIALANLEPIIDLENEVINTYGDGCWNCKQKPCICPGFTWEAVRG